MIPQCGKNQDIDEVRLMSASDLDHSRALLHQHLRNDEHHPPPSVPHAAAPLWSNRHLLLGRRLLRGAMNPIYSATKVALTAVRRIAPLHHARLQRVCECCGPRRCSHSDDARSVPSGYGVLAGISGGNGQDPPRGPEERLHAHRLHHGAALGDRDSPRRYALHCQGYILRALIPVFKVSKQYLIEFHPPTENYGCLLKTGKISQSLRMPPPLFPFLLPGAVYCVPLIMFRLFCRMEAAFNFRFFLRFSWSFRCCFCASIIFFVSFFWWMASRFRLRIPGIDDL